MDVHDFRSFSDDRLASMRTDREKARIDSLFPSARRPNRLAGLARRLAVAATPDRRVAGARPTAGR